MSEQSAIGPGVFVAIVGPSGTGKDGLIGYAREHLQSPDRFHFPCRFITRPAGDDNERHQPVSCEEFDRFVNDGAFALSWQAHGLRYAIGTDADDAIAAGQCVIANLSRTVLDILRRRYCAVRIIAVSTPHDVLAERLKARGRENDAGIAGRLARADIAAPRGDDVVELVNDAALEAAGERLVSLLRTFASP